MPTQQRETEGQHRLTDMLVEEVSFVDRGANRKRFLVVKRGTTMPKKTDELVPDGRGGMRRVTKADDGDGDQEEKAGKKPPPFGGNKAPPFKPKPKGGDEEEDEPADKGMGEGDEEGDDEEDASKKKPEKATKGVVRKNMLATITQAIELLMDCAEELKDSEGDDEEGEYEAPESVMANAKKAHGLLAKMCGAEGAKKADTGALAKAGRRMSKERLDRFTKAITDLQAILKEVMAQPELKDDTEKRGAELRKALARVAKGGGGEDTRVEQLAESLTELVEHTRVLEAKNTKLEKKLELLRKGEGSSNALGVEGRDEGAGGGAVKWPTDLNAPDGGDFGNDGEEY